MFQDTILELSEGKGRATILKEFWLWYDDDLVLVEDWTPRIDCCGGYPGYSPNYGAAEATWGEILKAKDIYID